MRCIFIWILIFKENSRYNNRKESEDKGENQMEHKVVLITGGTRGIGLAAARKFSEKGYLVAINGHHETRGDEAVKELMEQGFNAVYFRADVTKEAEVEKMINSVVEHFGRLDVLVNNAGGLQGRKAIEGMETKHWNSVMDLNLNSAFYASRSAIPHLKISGGSIINVTSIAAYMGGGPGAAAYAVTKSGLLAFTRGLAKELIPYGIRVNAVSPGTIDTDFHKSTNRDLLESWVKGIPAGRLGRAEDVANVIYFLASPEAEYLVGEVIQVNGGQDFR